jgi:hypothetical protein
MRAEYPESSGVNPIILNFGMEEFVHFPQVSDHNLTRLMAKEFRNDNVKKYNSLKEPSRLTTRDRDMEQLKDEMTVVTDSYKSLIDSRITIKYFKNVARRSRLVAQELQNMKEGHK